MILQGENIVLNMTFSQPILLTQSVKLKRIMFFGGNQRLRQNYEVGEYIMNHQVSEFIKFCQKNEKDFLKSSTFAVKFIFISNS